MGRVMLNSNVAGIPVIFRLTMQMGGGYELVLGLDEERKVYGRWLPRKPATWAPGTLAKRIERGVAALLLAAASREGLLIAKYDIDLPPASVSSTGGPLRRSRPKAARIVA